MLKKNTTQPEEASLSTRTGLPNLHLFEKNKEEIEHPPIKADELITEELIWHLFKKNKEETEGRKEIEETNQITLVDPQIPEESILLSPHNSSLIHRVPSGSNGCVEWLTRCLGCGLSFPAKMTLG